MGCLGSKVNIEDDGTESTSKLSNSDRKSVISNKNGMGEELDFSKMKKVVALYEYQKKTENGMSLKQGEILHVIDETDQDWWMVINPDTKAKGIVPSNFLTTPTDSSDKNLDSLEFYFPTVQRGECEQMLILSEMPGTFMIRPSNQAKAPYTLSLIDANRQIKHYRINFDLGMGYYIGESNAFPDLIKLVEYYRSGKDTKIIKLTKAVPKSGPTTAGLGKDIWEVNREKIQLLSRLGQGFYGEVWKGIFDKNTIVAVKTFKEGKMDPQDFLNEATIMKTVKHKRLVQLLAVCTVGTPLFIICEFMDNGCLKDYLINRKNTVQASVLVSMCCQICEGMEYLESIPIIHRDLAARNVLISKNCECKVADFGMALLHNDQIQIGNVNTHFPIRWTAPEAFEKKSFSNKSDVWSYGVLMWEILTFCENPYGGMTNKEVFQYVQQEKILGKPDICSSTFYEIMKSCFRKNPENRPSFKELLPSLQAEEKLAVDKGGLYNEL